MPSETAIMCWQIFLQNNNSKTASRCCAPAKAEWAAERAGMAPPHPASQYLTCKLMKSPLHHHRKSQDKCHLCSQVLSLSVSAKAALHKASGSLLSSKELQCDGQTTVRVLRLPVVSSSEGSSSFAQLSKGAPSVLRDPGVASFASHGVATPARHSL